MKTLTNFHKIIFVLLAVVACSLLLFAGCKKGNNKNTATNATSHICGNVTGIEAIYWDLMNGIPRTDFPGGVPKVTTIGGSYSNPTFPLLSFIYPPGYTPQTDNTSGAVGVNLFRNDNQAIWRYTSIFFSGTTTPQAVLTSEITNLRTFLKSTGAVSTICSQATSLPRAAGITSNIASAYVQFDSFTAAINITITTETGLGAEQINIVTTAAPTSQFASEITKTFLPLDYQLLYTGGGEIDSDGDGYPDSEDAFPFDASKH
ncbi:MAG: hypothetical protein ABI203_04055 [Mucilaginibacter sp.]